MKKLLLLVVSVLLTGIAFASNLGRTITSLNAKDTSETISQKMDHALILEQPLNVLSGANLLNSHQSHYSHSSHRSHYSHYSSR